MTSVSKVVDSGNPCDSTHEQALKVRTIRGRTTRHVLKVLDDCGVKWRNQMNLGIAGSLPASFRASVTVSWR